MLLVVVGVKRVWVAPGVSSPAQKVCCQHKPEKIFLCVTSAMYSRTTSSSNSRLSCFNGPCSCCSSSPPLPSLSDEAAIALEVFVVTVVVATTSVSPSPSSWSSDGGSSIGVTTPSLCSASEAEGDSDRVCATQFVLVALPWFQSERKSAT